MRSNNILDLKYMVIRTVENELSLDEHAEERLDVEEYAKMMKGLGLNDTK